VGFYGPGAVSMREGDIREVLKTLSDRRAEGRASTLAWLAILADAGES